MPGEIMYVSIDAASLVFGALVLVWVSLITDYRIRKATDALEATRLELAQVRSKLEVLQASAPKPESVAGLGQLGAAIASERQGAAKQEGDRLSPSC